MSRRFQKALKDNELPTRVGDVTLFYESHMWAGRADRPPRAPVANAALTAGVAFGVGSLGALVARAEPETAALLLAPCVAGFLGAAFLEQRDRRQRAFVVDFDALVLRLDFSTPIGGMPRTLRLAFDEVRDIAVEEQGADLRLLCVDFERAARLYREVLIASVPAPQLAACERVRRMLRAAIGLDPPAAAAAPDADGGPPRVIDSFG